MIRASLLASTVALLLLAGCSDDDNGDGDDAAAATTTIDAPLRPELQQSAQGGIGTVEEWVETWGRVNDAVASQASNFPQIPLSVDDVTVRGGEDGLLVFTADLGGVVLGGVLGQEDGGITSLLITGSPDEPSFFAAFSVWLGTIDPSVDPLVLLPAEVAFGDQQQAGVESNGRTFEAIKVDVSGGSAVAVTMVTGRDVVAEQTASAHRVVRRNVLGAFAAES